MLNNTYYATGNYLRVRGEYNSFPTITGSLTELPPRARRILKLDAWGVMMLGTTSACAENTLGAS